MEHAQACDEARLIEHCRGGDLDAFDELVRMHQTRVYNIALRLMGDPDSAQDCAQDAFVRAFQGIRKFRAECAFSTWLYRITTNVCMDELRKRKPAESLSSDDETTVDPLERIPDTASGPEQTVLKNERRRLLMQALNGLTQHHRAVLVLYDLEGLSYEEVAQSLRISIGTVKSRLNRARLALKERMEPLRELFEG
jgi:RNA polymerase sigma-70 factor (ECF subfamily)